MDISDTNLLAKGESFTIHDGPHIYTFEWLEFDRLNNEHFYPQFLKEEIFNLSKEFTIRTEIG